MKWLSPLLSAALVLQVGTCVAASSNQNNPGLDIITSKLPYLERTADQLWPGLAAMNTLPIVLGSPDDTLYALRFQPSNPNDWKMQSINNQAVYYRSTGGVELLNEYSPLENKFAEKSAQRFDNQPVIIGYAASDSSDEMLNLVTLGALMGEHYFQYEYFYSPQAALHQQRLAQILPTYADFNNSEQLALLLLQDRYMREYLENGQLDTLKYYVAVAQERQTLLSANAKAAENAMLHASAPVSYFLFSTFDMQGNSINKALLNDQLEAISDILSLFYVYSERANNQAELLDILSASEMFALDKLSVDWKSRFENSDQAPGVFLREYVPMSAAEQAARVKAAKQRFAFPKLVAQLAKYDPLYQQALKSYQAFNSDPGVTVSLPVGNNGGARSYYNEIAIDSLHKVMYITNPNSPATFDEGISDEITKNEVIHISGQAIPTFIRTKQATLRDYLTRSGGQTEQRWSTQTLVSINNGPAQPLSALLLKPASYQVTQLTLSYEQRKLVITAKNPLTLTASASGLAIKDNSAHSPTSLHGLNATLSGAAAGKFSPGLSFLIKRPQRVTATH